MTPAAEPTSPAPDEKTDRVPGQPAVTEWKRAARRHQDAWRAGQGLAPGVVVPPRTSSASPRPIGSRIDDADAAAGRNFLSVDVLHAVEQRLAAPQDHEMIDTRRLYGDLLSSMPMCFNLFGPLAVDPSLAHAVARRWFPGMCPEDAQVRVEFEWSPGRRNPQWLDDRTAFDAVIFIDTPTQRRLVGIETKYHEHPRTEPGTRTNRKTGLKETRMPKDRYLAVNAAAGLCDDHTVMAKIWGTPLEQIWRDHLLALACAQHASDGWASTRYVLVGPAGNPAWPALAEEYLAVVPAAAETFEFRTVEALLDAAHPLLPQEEAFRERYLDVG